MQPTSSWQTANEDLLCCKAVHHWFRIQSLCHFPTLVSLLYASPMLHYLIPSLTYALSFLPVHLWIFPTPITHHQIIQKKDYTLIHNNFVLNETNQNLVLCKIPFHLPLPIPSLPVRQIFIPSNTLSLLPVFRLSKLTVLTSWQAI